MEISPDLFIENKDSERGIGTHNCMAQKKLQKAAYMGFCNFSVTPKLWEISRGVKGERQSCDICQGAKGSCICLWIHPYIAKAQKHAGMSAWQPPGGGRSGACPALELWAPSLKQAEPEVRTLMRRDRFYSFLWFLCVNLSHSLIKALISDKEMVPPCWQSLGQTRAGGCSISGGRLWASNISSSCF